MDAKYKALKEDFVSNLSGGSIWEMNLVTLVAPTSVLLWSVLQSRKRSFTPYTFDAAILDFLLNCGAILFVTTIYSGLPAVLNLFLVVPAIVTYLTPRVKFRSEKPRPPNVQVDNESIDKKDEDKQRVQKDLPIKPFVTTYRGAMMVVTCAAILAVDFKVFPRRFAKVENWGTSLMDMGVGSFVFSGGLVSARTILREQLSGKRISFITRLRQSILHSIPLLILGAVRMYSVKGLDYAEHVSEYGVHWNFFFTLGLLPPFVALFHFLFRFLPSFAVLSLIVAVGYQVALDSTELTAFILTAPRTDLFSQNREGIFSFLGYLAIFLAGQATGMYALPRQATTTGKPSLWSTVSKSVLGRLVLWSAIWSGLFFATTSYHGAALEVSRRLANLPYVLWVSAFNTTQLALFCAIETVCFPDLYKAPTKEVERKRCKDATSRVLFAFNRNGLLLFLVANLLTGAVNLTVPTLHVKNLQAMGILTGYMAVVTAFALGLDAWGFP